MRDFCPDFLEQVMRLTAGKAEVAIIFLLRSVTTSDYSPHIRIKDFAAIAHCSYRGADDALARLRSAGIIERNSKGRGYRLCTERWLLMKSYSPQLVEHVRIANRGGYVYAIKNPHVPGLVKIGRTTQTVEARSRSLSRGAGVPAPFAIVCKAATIDAVATEKRLHEMLAPHRLSGCEFFQIDDAQAVSAFNSLGLHVETAA